MRPFDERGDLPAGAGSVGGQPFISDRPTLRGQTVMDGAAEAQTRRKILVVEDEMLIGMLLEDMLADLGHDVVAVVPRVNEALAAVQREAFDLAILDVHLNGQAVFPVAESLIEKGVPFVFATGYGERGLPEKYRDRPVLQKPFAKDDLEKVLNAMVAGA